MKHVILILISLVFVSVASSKPSCELTPCHGLEVKCELSKSGPKMCTAVHQVGDLCREFAKCEMANGKCSMKTDSRFKTCYDCVKNCLKLSATDPMAASECEQTCAEAKKK